MTYVLTTRTTDHGIGARYHLWFLLACIFPITSMGVFEWNTGMSALLSFLGTAVTGFLQILLAVDMKRGHQLPS
jgi:hypothetical protein